jgi:hypothetical protein
MVNDRNTVRRMDGREIQQTYEVCATAHIPATNIPIECLGRLKHPGLVRDDDCHIGVEVEGHEKKKQ